MYLLCVSTYMYIHFFTHVMLLASLSNHVRQLSSSLKHENVSIAEVPSRWKVVGLKFKSRPIWPHRSDFKHNGKERRREEERKIGKMSISPSRYLYSH